MRRRRQVTGLLVAGAVTAGFGPSVTGAGAAPRTFNVTLLGGTTITVTLDVPPGTPLDQVRVPGVDLPIIGISEVGGSPPVVALPGSAQPAPPAEQPGGEAHTIPGAPQVAQEQQSQETSGKQQRKPSRSTDAALNAAERAAAKQEAAQRRKATTLRNADGSPTEVNPGYALSLPGVAPIGVPNFFIEKFRIPPFLLPIYQAAGIEYGVRWEILAAINEIETDYGRNLNVSSAGALGWMQFMPASWKQYGVDANRDGKKDPFNPVDAIFASARYLKAAGAEQDIRKAIFAYNHADWYVDSVLMRARLIGGLPADLVGSLTGLTLGKFPVDARATYADDLAEGATHRRGISIFAAPGSAVIAAQDSIVVRTGTTRRLGRFVQLRDVYGNTYTYARLGTVSRKVTRPARTDARIAGKERLYANPARARVAARRNAAVAKRLQRGTRVVVGTVLGRIGRSSDGTASHVKFEIRPAGRGAPRIDPKPILDGWKLLESTAVYRAAGENPFFGPDSKNPTIGQILLMSKEALQRSVLGDPRIDIYDCGRRDIKAGNVDRRVLATLAFLSASGLKPTVTSLTCGHGYLTASGNVSEHSTGTAMDIAKINGIPILGHQGAGSVTELTLRRLLTLQGTMKPHQLISLMTFDGADNTIALPDHADHIHIGFRPLYTTDKKLARQLNSALKPSQWMKLIDRLGDIDNPTVATKPSKYAIDADKDATAADRASSAHSGE